MTELEESGPDRGGVRETAGLGVAFDAILGAAMRYARYLPPVTLRATITLAVIVWFFRLLYSINFISEADFTGWVQPYAWRVAALILVPIATVELLLDLFHNQRGRSAGEGSPADAPESPR